MQHDTKWDPKGPHLSMCQGARKYFKALNPKALGPKPSAPAPGPEGHAKVKATDSTFMSPNCPS